MFGLDDLAIAGLIASIAGAGISYQSSANAAKKAQEASLNAMRHQQELQRQAERSAMDTAQNFRTENREEQQQQIQNRLEQEYSAPAIDAQTINAQAATTQGDVSGDYQTKKAVSDANVESLAKNFARMMARAGAAKQLRTNEAYDMSDAASRIGLLQNFSQGQEKIDRLAIQDAANSGETGNMLGSLLTSLGTAGMMYGGNTKTMMPSIVNSPTYTGYIGQARKGLL